MIKTKKLIPVYSKKKMKNGKTTERSNIYFANKKPGVYLIFKKGQSKPIYIGHSKSDLYKVVTRHFQAWEFKDPRQVRVTYLHNRTDYLVRLIFTPPKKAEKLERVLILKYKPIDNPQKYESYKLDFDTKPIEKEFANAPEMNVPF